MMSLRKRAGLSAVLVTVFVSAGSTPALEATPQEQAAAEQPAAPQQRAAAQKLGLPVAITNSMGMKLVLIPAGEFMMGSRESAEELTAEYEEYLKGHPQPEVTFACEQPYHRVRITKPFYLEIHEVTQEQYERVMGNIPSRFAGNPQCAVAGVTWNDAVDFCRRLSRIEAVNYRLPTEAEWEYACRAGSTSRFYFGDDPADLDQYAWTGKGWRPEKRSLYKPHPGGEKKPNAWGLYDMLGNVSEWCADWYGADYYASSPFEDPTGPPSGTQRVCRGSCWEISIPYYHRSCYRPTPRGVGFRVARTPGDSRLAGDAVSRDQAAATSPSVAESSPRPANTSPLPGTASRAEARPNPAVRKWTDDSGRYSVVAVLIDVRDGQVELKKNDGEVVTVPIARLSEADRRYLAELKHGASDTGGRQPATQVRGVAAAEGIENALAKTAPCQFQVFGLVHKEMGRVNEELAHRDRSFARFVFTNYGFCDECWEKIKADEGYQEFQKYDVGGRTGDYDNSPDRYDPRLVPWDLHASRFPLDTDLAPIAKAVVMPRPPHRAVKTFYALLHIKSDVKQAKLVQKVLAGLPGVDARQSRVDLQAASIHVRITGQKSIRMTDIIKAFQEASIIVSTYW